MNDIFILTGEVHTGKTTNLMQWGAAQKSIDGIYQPVIDEKRFIYHIGSKTLKPLETTSTNSMIIGNYKFSLDTFEWAKEALLNCLDKQPEWIVIDEIGPLELKGKGLEPAITTILSVQNKTNCKIVCVVRQNILEDFIGKYALNNRYQIFNL